MFLFDENERDKKDLKKDFKKLEKKYKNNVKFKNLIGITHILLIFIDFYLTSSEVFGKSLENIDTGKILDGLESAEDGFNEKLLKLLCINQAISKVQKELVILEDIKERLVTVL